MMIVRALAAKAAPRFFLIGILCLTLAGCFDLVARLSLNTDGSGKVSIRLAFTREMTGMITASGKPPFGPKNANPNVKREFFIKDGQAIQEETTTFQSLNDVVFGVERIQVVDLGRTLMGARRNRITWTIEVGGNQPKKMPPPGLFAGHTFEIAMDLPCTIESATNVEIANTSIAPSTSFAGGSVSWKIPLPAVLSETRRRSISFQTECWSWAGMKAATSRFGGTSALEAPIPPRPQPPVPPPPAYSPAPTPVQVRDILLDQFPLLSQMDSANYERGSAIYDAWDTVDSTDPLLKRPVPKLACLATVYAMIERGTGGSNRTIDSFYRLGKGGGGVPDKLTNVTVDTPLEERPLDVFEIATSVRRGDPVILHGIGGPLGHHFVLVVGVVLQGDDVRQLIINDPWPQGGKGAAQQNRIAATSPVITYPYAGVTFGRMRLVKRKDRAVFEELPRKEPTTPIPAIRLTDATKIDLISQHYRKNECAEYFVLKGVELSTRPTGRANYALARLTLLLAPPREPQVLGGYPKFGMCTSYMRTGMSDVGKVKHLVVGFSFARTSNGWEVASMEQNPAIESACLCPWSFEEDRIARCNGCGTTF